MGPSQLNYQKRLSISTCSSWKLFMFLIFTWFTVYTPQNSLFSQRYVCDAYDVHRTWCCCILFISASLSCVVPLKNNWVLVDTSQIYTYAGSGCHGNRGTTFSCSILRHTLIYQRELDPAISRRTWSNSRCVHKQPAVSFTLIKLITLILLTVFYCNNITLLSEITHFMNVCFCVKICTVRYW